jgi:endoglycosylceramidase
MVLQRHPHQLHNDFICSLLFYLLCYIDEHGRVSFFHGTNFVQKGYPWYPEALLDHEHVKEIKSWGFNTLRLGVMWSGVEPELGVFNETYISIIDGILDDCEANGIHALIDVHQGNVNCL